MYVTLKIGDCTLVISEVQRNKEDQTHSVQVTDVWDKVSSLKEVENEAAAIEVLTDFLQMDEPTGAFKELFPEHCP